MKLFNGVIYLGLDKWLKPEEDLKSPKKKKSKDTSKSLTKFNLICTKPKCKYQKIIMKRELLEKDKICPKCKSQMKIKKQ